MYKVYLIVVFTLLFNLMITAQIIQDQKLLMTALYAFVRYIRQSFICVRVSLSLCKPHDMPSCSDIKPESKLWWQQPMILVLYPHIMAWLCGVLYNVEFYLLKCRCSMCFCLQVGTYWWSPRYHTITCQNWPCIGPILTVLARYRPSSGTLWHGHQVGICRLSQPEA